MADEDLQLVLDEATDSMAKAVEALHRELSKIRTGRANPTLLEGLMVDYYGAATPLKSLATVAAPEPRLLVVQPFDPGSIPEIERSIRSGDLGMSPQNDGKLIRIPVPELTEERRREVVKTVKKMGEEHKVRVRNARRDAISALKDFQKDGDITEDESHRGQKTVQDLTDQRTKEIDALLDSKEEELLTI